MSIVVPDVIGEVSSTVKVLITEGTGTCVAAFWVQDNLIFVSIQVPSALYSAISKFVYIPKSKKKKNLLYTVSHMGFEPTILRSRVQGASGHPYMDDLLTPCAGTIWKI